MTDLLALAETMEKGALRCVECGVNVIIVNPDTDKLTLVGATVFEDEGEFYAHCTVHDGQHDERRAPRC